MSSSSISAALEELSRLPASDRALLSGQCPGLAEYLAWVRRSIEKHHRPTDVHGRPLFPSDITQFRRRLL
ncbi:hypothetical protein, partial [Nonomuraea sp. NPDC049784]|uniref:hypothetical protein n=1 Tax=Nonomuraea sp. NPDC049784 TaxID=3154361 RepID=UPI0033DC9E1A